MSGALIKNAHYAEMVQWLMCANKGGRGDSVSPDSLIASLRNTEEYSFDLLVSLSKEFFLNDKVTRELLSVPPMILFWIQRR